MQALFVCVSEKSIGLYSVGLCFFRVRAATSVTGMEGSVKNKIPIIKSWRADSKRTAIYFQLRLLSAGHSIHFIFFTVLEWLARLFAQGHKQKVRSTPLLPCGLPKEARRGRDCVPAVRLGISGAGTFSLH